MVRILIVASSSSSLMELVVGRCSFSSSSNHEQVIGWLNAGYVVLVLKLVGFIVLVIVVIAGHGSLGKVGERGRGWLVELLLQLAGYRMGWYCNER